MENEKSPEGQELMLKIQTLEDKITTYEVQTQIWLKKTYYATVCYSFILFMIFVQLLRINIVRSRINENLASLNDLVELNADISNSTLLIFEQILLTVELIYELVLGFV